MLRKHFLSHLLFHLKLCKFLKCVPYHWDAQTERLVMLKEGSFSIYLFKVPCYISIVYTFVLCLHMGLSPLPISRRLQGTVYLTAFIVFAVARFSESLDNESIQVFNSFLKFEEINEQKNGSVKLPPPKTVELLRMYLINSVYSVPFVPLLCGLLVLKDPCTPPFLLSISKECGNIQWGIPTPLFILGAEIWICTQLFYAGCFWTFYTFPAAVGCFLGYLGRLKVEIRTNPSQALKAYKELQLLESLLNGFLNHRIMPIFIFAVSLAQISAQYVCLKLYNQIPFPAFLAFPGAVGHTGSFIVIVISCAAELFKRSKKVLKNLEKEGMIMKNMTRLEKKVFRREVKSCQSLKISFGSNFVDRATPMVMEHFCFEQTVSLTLLNNGRG